MVDRVTASFFKRRTVFLGCILAVSAGAASAQMKPSTLLDQFEPGRWEARVLGQHSGPQRMCARSARAFIQMHHPGQSCRRVSLEEDGDQVTVQYTCREGGYGRTHLRRENDRLWQIESQGIAKGLPFTYEAEARRVGSCAN